MNNGGGNGGGSFKVKHGSYAAEVTNVHEAGAGEVGDVVGERAIRIESNTKITDRGISGESIPEGNRVAAMGGVAQVGKGNDQMGQNRSVERDDFLNLEGEGRGPGVTDRGGGYTRRS